MRPIDVVVVPHAVAVSGPAGHVEDQVDTHDRAPTASDRRLALDSRVWFKRKLVKRFERSADWVQTRDHQSPLTRFEVFDFILLSRHQNCRSGLERKLAPRLRP